MASFVYINVNELNTCFRAFKSTSIHNHLPRYKILYHTYNSLRLANVLFVPLFVQYITTSYGAAVTQHCSPLWYSTTNFHTLRQPYFWKILRPSSIMMSVTLLVAEEKLPRSSLTKKQKIGNWTKPHVMKEGFFFMDYCLILSF